MPEGYVTTEILRGTLGTATARAQLIGAINGGQKLVNYMGHGAPKFWNDNLLTVDDVGTLSNQNKLAMFIVMSCFSGLFHDSTDNLAEALLKSKAGAIAVWASSNLSLVPSHVSTDKELFKALLGTDGLTIGDAVLRAKSASYDPDIRLTWILFGDPTLRLR